MSAVVAHMYLYAHVHAHVPVEGSKGTCGEGGNPTGDKTREGAWEPLVVLGTPGSSQAKHP